MKRIKLHHKGKAIISDAFNMKAFRVMYDTLKDSEITPERTDAAATNGLIAVFDGTEITEDVVLNWRELDELELLTARTKILEWFSDVRPKKEQTPTVGEPPENPILSLYKKLLDRHLPSEVDKQDPQLLWDVITADSGTLISANEIPDNMKEYYGF